MSVLLISNNTGNFFYCLCYFLILANNASNPELALPETSTCLLLVDAYSGEIQTRVLALIETTPVTALKVGSFPHCNVSSSLYLLLSPPHH